jgi:hypothetical protein
VKARLLLTSALLMFVQIPAPQAQVTVDVAKITCEQFSMEELPFNSRDVIPALVRGRSLVTDTTRLLWAGDYSESV